MPEYRRSLRSVSSGLGLRALALDVVPGDLPNACDGWAVAEGAVGASLVVVADPVWQ